MSPVPLLKASETARVHVPLTFGNLYFAGRIVLAEPADEQLARVHRLG